MSSVIGVPSSKGVVSTTRPYRKYADDHCTTSYTTSWDVTDLGYPDAPVRQVKLRLAYALNHLLEQRELTQAAAAQLLRLTQPKVSALRHYKLAGFSVERLMTLLTVLDRDVEIVIRKKPRSRSAARISVVAA